MRLPLELALPPVFSSSPSPSTVLIDGELFLLELQGELELSSKDAGEQAPVKAGQRIGKLDLSVPTRPTLLIGHHRLVGKLANLPAPMAILKHTLPRSVPAASSQAEHPPTSSPTGAGRFNAVSSSSKRDRTDAEQGDYNDDQEDAQPAAKRLGVTFSASATPARPSSSTGVPASSPASSAAITSSTVRPPTQAQTPIGVSELKRGTHQIVGIITRKIIFSKRPEPVVTIAPQSSDEEEEQDDDDEEEAAV